ncbi:hypothetical protein Tco_0742967 [Tanacetum coccineum]
MKGGQNLRMKTYFNSSQVFSNSDEVLPNHLLTAPVRVKGKFYSIMSFPEIPEPDIVLAFIEGINVGDRNGCDIFLLRNCLSRLAKGVNTFVLLLLVMIEKEG